MKKKKLSKGKRIVAGVLAGLLCTAGVVGIVNSKKIMAYMDWDTWNPDKWPVSDMTNEQREVFNRAYDGVYVGGSSVKDAYSHLATVDMVNGERILTADQKANVMTNIYKKKEKLTILEIVPYRLSAVFGILMPSEEQKKIVESYAPDIFNTFGPAQIANTGTWSPDENARLLATWQHMGGNTSISGKYEANDNSKNYIANGYQPIEITRTPSGGGYNYDVYMPCYYMLQLLKGYEDTKLYKYFVDDNNVEIITVTSGELNADPNLLNTYLDRADKVDLIYIGGMVNDPTYFIYRNIFLSGGLRSDDATAQKMMNLVKSGTVDPSFKTGVYYKDGSEYKEYSVTDLTEKEVWFDSYTKVGSDYYYNDLTWANVEKIVAYIFGNTNQNYLFTATDSEGNILYKEQQRVAAMVNVANFSGGSWFSRTGGGIDNNIGKLYYILEKSTDQTKDYIELEDDDGHIYREGCPLCGADMNPVSNTHINGFGTASDYGTHTHVEGIKTSVHDPDYFYKKYFISKDPGGNTYKFANGLTTAAYDYDGDGNGDVVWPVNFSNVNEVKNFMNIDKEKALMYLSTEIDGRYIVHNGFVGIFNQNKMLDNSQTWSGGGTRGSGVYNRLEEAVGDVFTQYNITNYFLGVDETDFITKPKAEFTELGLHYLAAGWLDFIVEKKIEQVANSKASYAYIYEVDRHADDGTGHDLPIHKINLTYTATDETAKMTEAVLSAYTQNGTLIKVLKTYGIDDLKEKTEFTDTYEITQTEDPEVYDAFMNGNVYFTFSVSNEFKLQNKPDVKKYTDTAYLFIKDRDLHPMD